MSDKLSWGILTTGGIARRFAAAVAASRTGELVAVGSRDQTKADQFGDEFGVPRRHGSYEDLLADELVEAVYVAPPHPMHAEWAIKTAQAGKHVLCEKPLAMNYAEAMAIVEAAQQNDVFLMEAFMYRCSPQTAKLVELIREKAIGEVRVIQATFSFQAAFDPESRLLKHSLGGGGILDVGCYCASMARLIAGVAMGEGFADPIDVNGAGHLGSVTRVDEWAIAALRFPGDIVAQLATGVQVGQENIVRVFGSEGHLVVPEPWFPARDGGATKILVYQKGEAKPREVVVESPLGLYSVEADTVATYLDERQAPSPAMSWDDTLGNMRTLDRWRQSIGLLYDWEKPEANVPTIDRRPLKVRTGHGMKYGNVEGVSKPVSRLVMGTMLEGSTLPMPHATVMFDEFFARGGNCFDTAQVYAGGLGEQCLGQWIKNRGLRDEVVIICKGAHTPFCDPDHLTAELMSSLERFQTDFVDIYMMHRDNPDIPVGEFVDVLNEHRAAGRIGLFGGSNWSIDRVNEANAYAAERGLEGFTVVSNNFSLARMVAPVWAGCISASDADSRAWLQETQISLMPWSSQARGFFSGRAHPEDQSDRELVRCWYSEDNFRRLGRAKQMAEKRGVQTISIALAYVLCQPFATFPLIGPRTPGEIRTSFDALEVELTPDELRWLNLE